MKNLMLFVILIAVVLSLPSIHSISINDLKWRVGDYWKYEEIWWEGIPSNLISKRVVMEYRVVGIENISFYGKEYRVYRVKENIYPYNFTGFHFYRIDDLAYIGGYSYLKAGLIIYYPPMEKFKFLQLGKEWNQTITQINEEPDGEITENKTLIIHYKCVGKENIKTKAGNFECYIIKQYESDSNSYTINYFSPAVKNIVLIKYQENNKNETIRELISTSYNKEIPFFYYLYALIALILLLISVWFIKNKNRGKKVF